MAQSFTVTSSSPKIVLSKEPNKPQTAEIIYTVTNKSEVALRGRVKIFAIGKSKSEWFKLEDKFIERDYAINESVSIKVVISVPPNVEAGNYQFRLDAFSEESPEEDFTEGQSVSFDITSPAPVKKDSKLIWIIIAIAGGLILISGIIYLLFVRSLVKVPDVTSMNIEQAKETLKNASLKESTVCTMCPTDSIDWTISEQNPAAKLKVKKNTEVVLTITEGVEVPDLSGQTEVSAKSKLTSLGFTTINAGTGYKTGAVPGTIISTNPPSGKIVMAGISISYTVQKLPDVQVTEDCLSCNPNNIQLVAEGSQVLMKDGNSRMLMFPNMTEAQKALRIIKAYRLNQQCFIGRPAPSLRYWKSSNQAPQGALVSSEDCVSFNPSNLRVIRHNSTLYQIVDGSHAVFAAPNATEANTIINICKKYGFTKYCFVGRPDPSFTYLKK
ncbi:MAG: PASTA domain-containing protein [Fibrobacter sp.]|nr:PASTA domain-containing protein [Fibrobacter sp.]